MHALEKIMAHHAGVAEVCTGEIVNCLVDTAGINDIYLQVVHSFTEINGKRVKYPDNVLVFMDHYAPASSVRQAENQKAFRDFCREQSIAGLMDVHEGVCHQVLADRGYSKPGSLIVVTDSHTTTHGAFGAFGTGVGATDLACILKTGMLWFRVPEIVRINLVGELQEGVSAKDVILHMIGDLGADYAVYRGVEFAGAAIAKMTIAQRMTICNMCTEFGAKVTYIQPDEVTFAHLAEVGADTYTVYETDKGYSYWAEHTYDISTIGPQIAAPASVDNVSDISRYLGVLVQQAYLGSCTGGRLEDLAVAAEILKGRQVHKDTRMLVVPASRQVLMDAMERGYMQTLVAAGATFVTPSCAACLGTHEGLIASGETCISAANRNFPGRMGHREGKIYLASPAVVAASALEGRIADPVPYMRKEGGQE